MQRRVIINGLLAMLITTSGWAQQLTDSSTETRIKPDGENYVLERSDSKASNLPVAMEQFAILETGSKGEAKADVHKVVLERSFDTPNRIRVKMKTPLFKYKPVMSGTNFFVESTKDVLDEKTGLIIRVKDYQKKRLVWCGLEPCLLSTAFLIQACVKDQKTCSSAYDTIIIDFSKAKALNIGETEEFFISSYQRKIPGKAIDFFVYPVPGRIQVPRYIVEHKKKLFGPDVYVVRMPTQKEIDAENKQVVPKDVLDLEAAAELNRNTRYTTLPTNIGMPGQPANPNGQSNSNGSLGEAVEELCLDEMGRVSSTRTIFEGGSYVPQNSTTNHSRHSNISHKRIYRGTTIVESSEGDIRNAENNVDTSECNVRKMHLILQESLAGQKGAVNRDEIIQRNRNR